MVEEQNQSQLQNRDSSSSLLSSEEYQNPHFLNHANSPGRVLVSQLLIRDNYSTWSHSMTMALAAKNKIGLTNGSILKPNPSDPE